jgi:methionyl-tRNA formyltransferase
MDDSRHPNIIVHVRIVFLGTPEFAVPSLERLSREAGIELTGVVCQPDRPAGRGGALRAPAVKLAAAALGLPVFQPQRIGSPEGVAWLRKQAPDALAVVAFGQLLAPAVFALPRYGAINAHASLLPQYRGAAPIQWAIARGEATTGVTTMRIDAGLDTGDMLMERTLAIPPEATARDLAPALAALAAELMVETFHALEAGAITPRPQPPSGSLAPRLRREDGRVHWQAPARDLYNRWRGFQPWPGLHTFWRGRQMAILACHPVPPLAAAQPGQVVFTGSELMVQCGDGALRLDHLRLEGRNPVSGPDFARGAHLEPGERLGE